MVDLLPVEDSDDLAYLQTILEEFVAATGSQVGQRLLESWPAAAQKFVKVFPHEYQRALQELKDEVEATNNLSVQVNGSVIMSPNLDIRNAYVIDNSPEIPGSQA